MDDIKYLNRVLNTWREFCRTHKNIERAIKNLIKENQELRAENMQLKKICDGRLKFYHDVKVKTQKEFVDRIKNQIKNNTNISAEWLRTYLDDLLKEKAE